MQEVSCTRACHLVLIISVLWMTTHISNTSSLSNFSLICFIKDTHSPRLALYNKYFNVKDVFDELHLQSEPNLNGNEFHRIVNERIHRMTYGLNLTNIDERHTNNLSVNLENVYLNYLFEHYSNNETHEITKDGLQEFLHDANLEPTSSIQKNHLLTFRKYYNIGATLNNSCLDSEEIIDAFDIDKSGTLDINEFLQICAYVTQHYIDGIKCGSDSHKEPRKLSSLKVYLYGSLVVATISVCSALGFIIIPRLPPSTYEILMAAFIALAFGTLTGDALLHLIPEALALDPDDDGGGVKISDSFWKCLTIMLSIYALFVFEGLPHVLFSSHTHQEKHKVGDHGHSHIHSHDYVLEQTQKKEIAERKNSFDVESHNDKKKIAFSPTQAIFQQQATVCIGLTTLALVIIIGDAIHNVTDGMAIGAAFAHDMKTGLSTSIAILFHELPHEFGDFVILLSTGMTLKRALIWNFVCSLTSFIGLYIGIAIGQNEYANQWIFAVTTGMFLYVAIGDMLPEMKTVNTDKKILAFIAQNVGVLCGMGFMVFMYFLEMLLS